METTAAGTGGPPPLGDPVDPTLFRHRDVLTALGTAALFVSQAQPFHDYAFGPWVDTLKGQILRTHYFFTRRGGQLVGYCGWALTSHDSARDWIDNRRTLSFEECRDGPCVVVMAARALTPAIQRFHTRVMRAIHSDREVTYWKRQTDTGTRLVEVALQAPGVRRPPPDFEIEWVGTDPFRGGQNGTE